MLLRQRYRARERLIDAKACLCTFADGNGRIDWLASLPAPVLDARPHVGAVCDIAAGYRQTTGVEEKLQAAEAAFAAGLQGAHGNDRIHNFTGQIAAARATVALTHYQPEAMLAQSLRALEFLPPTTYPSAPPLIGRWPLPTSSRVTGRCQVGL